MTTYADRAHELIQDEDRRFGLMVGASVGLHVVFVAAVSLWNFVLPAEPLIKLDEAIEVDLITLNAASSSARSKSGLPNKETHKPLPSPESAPPSIAPPVPSQQNPNVVQQPDTAIAKAQAPREATSITDALKKDTPPPPSPQDPGLDSSAMDALSRVMSKQSLRDRVAKLSGAEGARDRSAGSSGAGGSGSGDAANCAGDPGWCNGLVERISAQWIILPSMANKTVEVLVLVKVDAEGAVREVTVEKSSGDTSFDNYAARAVRKTGNLPLPTKADLRASILADGLVLVFNPRGLSR